MPRGAAPRKLLPAQVQRARATLSARRQHLSRRAAPQVFVGGAVSYAYTCIPTYPSGQIGFMLCSKEGDVADFLTPQRPPPEGGAWPSARRARAAADASRPDAHAGASHKPLRYYNAGIHRAAFALPEFARAALAGSLTLAR